MVAREDLEGAEIRCLRPVQMQAAQTQEPFGQGQAEGSRACVYPRSATLPVCPKAADVVLQLFLGLFW